MKNVKLDWAPVLEGQIKHLESLYPEIPVRKSFENLIHELNENKIKSRVILSGINVAAYAFIAPSGDYEDRLYGSLGFTNPSFATQDRLANLIMWLEDTARIQKKYLMVDRIYNADQFGGSYLESNGFTKFKRDRMILDIGDYKLHEISQVGSERAVPITKINPEIYSEVEFQAYKGTVDQILFNVENSAERLIFVKKMFDGRYGVVLSEASFALLEGDKIAGATLCTDYKTSDGSRISLLADIFVSKEYRGKGYAGKLLHMSLNGLKKLGYEECHLWVSEGNPAVKLYEREGFKVSGTSEIFYFKKP